MSPTIFDNQNGTGLKKSRTGIKGFEELTNGGLPLNRSTILVGATGTGKTIMAMEYIVNGALQFNDPGVFMTFEEKTDDLCENVKSLKYDLKRMVEEKKIVLEHLTVSHNELHEIGKYNIEGLFHKLGEAIDSIKAKRVVLDSFDTLFSNFETKSLRSEFIRLFSWLKEKKVTAIITAEMGNDSLTRLGIEENIADCVIEINNRVVNQIAVRRIRIIKYRGSIHANNEYPFLIDETGMTIFPIISQGMEQKTSTERLSTGIPTLDQMLENKGFYLGSNILISGTAGTGKTSITSSFACEVNKKNELVLYCAFEETPSQILRNMKSVGILMQEHVDLKRLHFYYARPSLQNLELHFLAIKDIIEKINPKVIVLDPITNLMTEGANSDVRSMLTRFIDYLKTKQITGIFTAAITIGTIAQNPSDEGISSMVDTWIMLTDSAMDGERTTMMYVMKSRGMKHSKSEMKLEINSTGLSFHPLSEEVTMKY
jgi:circadian clock protein KaiC